MANDEINSETIKILTSLNRIHSRFGNIFKKYSKHLFNCYQWNFVDFLYYNFPILTLQNVHFESEMKFLKN